MIFILKKYGKHASHCLTCVCSSVTLEIECVIEAFATEGTKVALDRAVTLYVPVEESLKRKPLLAHFAYKVVFRLFDCNKSKKHKRQCQCVGTYVINSSLNYLTHYLNIMSDKQEFKDYKTFLNK